MGGQVVLLGEPGTLIPVELIGEMIIYSDSFIRKKEIDIFLCACCKFFIGCSSGISHVPGLFNVNTLYLNLSPVFSRPWRNGDIWIPKKLKIKKNNTFLSFKKMTKLPYCLIDTKEGLSKQGLEIIDNTSTEIIEAVKDMFDQVNGDLLPNDNLQNYVNSLFPNEYKYYFKSILSPRFVLINPDIFNFKLFQ